MKAIGYKSAGAIDRDDSLMDIEVERPVAKGRDILVEVEAISVNPVDYKIRKSTSANDGEWKILGWDAVGKVVETGPDVVQFNIGDLVYYAGSILRPGTNSQYHLVDERIVGRKPNTISNAEAAALPLTTLTAYELLFDRLNVKKPVPGVANAIVIVGGGGSIAIQLARALTDLTVIATASRAETQEWVRELGAHYVIDHSKPLAAQVAALGIGAPAFIFSTTETNQHLKEIIELIAPQGRFGLMTIRQPSTSRDSNARRFRSIAS